MADKKTCYIIGPIGDADSEPRKWADFVREYIVKRAITFCGYAEPARADDPDTGLIMPGVIGQMFDADLVIADLTDYNPNVLYELGIRHCAQKPVIHLIKNGQHPPFDLGNNKAIFIDRDHLVVEQAVNDIKTRIQAIENNPEQFHSDVHIQIELRHFKIWKKSSTLKEMEFVDRLLLILERMVDQQGKTHETIQKLYEELVEKPKQSSTQMSYSAAMKALLQPSNSTIEEIVKATLKGQQKK